MSGSDSNDALRDLVPDILGIRDDDDELFMTIDAFYWEDEDADLWNSDDELDHAELHMLQNLSRPRSAQTYKYSGDQARKAQPDSTRWALHGPQNRILVIRG
jgi:hypothetical protein